MLAPNRKRQFQVRHFAFDVRDLFPFADENMEESFHLKMPPSWIFTEQQSVLISNDNKKIFFHPLAGNLI